MAEGAVVCWCCGGAGDSVAVVGGMVICGACVKNRHPTWENVKEYTLTFTCTNTSCKHSVKMKANQQAARSMIFNAKRLQCKGCREKGKLIISVSRELTPYGERSRSLPTHSGVGYTPPHVGPYPREKERAKQPVLAAARFRVKDKAEETKKQVEELAEGGKKDDALQKVS